MVIVNNIDPSYVTKHKKHYTTKIISLLLSIFLLLNFISPTTIAEPFECEVRIILDKHNIVYVVEPNCTYEFVISGNVSCMFSGIGEGFQYIEVHLWAGSYESWYTAISPTALFFHNSGTKSLNLTVNLPKRVYNNTKNVIIVSGSWQAKYAKNNPLGASGNPNTENVNATVYRTFPVDIPKTIKPEYDEYFEWENSWGLPFSTFVILIIIILNTIIVGVYLYRRKKWKEFLNEKK